MFGWILNSFSTGVKCLWHEKSIKIDLRASHPNGDATLLKKYAADTYLDEALVKKYAHRYSSRRDGTLLKKIC
jgi:hypothetical protein